MPFDGLVRRLDVTEGIHGAEYMAIEVPQAGRRRKRGMKEAEEHPGNVGQLYKV